MLSKTCNLSLLSVPETEKYALKCPDPLSESYKGNLLKSGNFWYNHISSFLWACFSSLITDEMLIFVDFLSYFFCQKNLQWKFSWEHGWKLTLETFVFLFSQNILKFVKNHNIQVVMILFWGWLSWPVIVLRTLFLELLFKQYCIVKIASERTNCNYR